MEELTQRKKYLGIIISRLAPKKADQLLPERSPGKANCNFSAHWFHSTNDQAYSQAYYQAEVKSTS